MFKSLLEDTFKKAVNVSHHSNPLDDAYPFRVISHLYDMLPLTINMELIKIAPIILKNFLKLYKKHQNVNPCPKLYNDLKKMMNVPTF